MMKKTSMMAFKDFAAKDWQGSIIVLLIVGYVIVCVAHVVTRQPIDPAITAFKDLLLAAVGYYFGSKAAHAE